MSNSHLRCLLTAWLAIASCLAVHYSCKNYNATQVKHVGELAQDRRSSIGRSCVKCSRSERDCLAREQLPLEGSTRRLTCSKLGQECEVKSQKKEKKKGGGSSASAEEERRGGAGKECRVRLNLTAWDREGRVAGECHCRRPCPERHVWVETREGPRCLNAGMLRCACQKLKLKMSYALYGGFACIKQCKENCSLGQRGKHCIVPPNFATPIGAPLHPQGWMEQPNSTHTDDNNRILKPANPRKPGRKFKKKVSATYDYIY